MSGLLYSKELFTYENWSALFGASNTLVLAEAAQAQTGTHLVITKDNLRAQQLVDDLQYFYKDAKNTPSVMLFPDWETLPYDQFSPHQDIISERLRTLYQLQHEPHALVIASVNTLMHRLCPKAFLQQFAMMLEVKQTVDPAKFRANLIEAGYRHVEQVLEHGEFASRGSLLDVFPMGSRYPYRIEWFDDEIDSIRLFDAETQRTINKIQSIAILPAREFPLTADAISQFRRQFREAFSGNPTLSPIYEGISEKQTPAGIEYYLALFFNSTAIFFDYLPVETKLYLLDDIPTQAAQFWQDVKVRYEQRNFDITRPILPPERVFLPADDFLHTLKSYNRVRLYSDTTERKGRAVDFGIELLPNLAILRQSNDPLEKLRVWTSQHPYRVLILVESAGRREVVLDLLKQSQMNPKYFESWQDFLSSKNTLGISIAPIQLGAVLHRQNIALITETELFGTEPTPQRRSSGKSISADLIIRDLAELRIGVPVVHQQFGVGRYQGLQTLESGGISNEFLILSYAGSDRIYVPVTALHMISRYTGSDSDHAPLHRLGGEQWQKEKKKAGEKIHDVAVELLNIYAKRAAKPGMSHAFAADEYLRFASYFPFSETPDQLDAIQAIIDDLKSDKPMDRLICGDVGFGKTEVAMRAAFVCVHGGSQVAVLVPTTLLASQHFETFRNRFADFPVRIELLSRSKNAKQTQDIMDACADGKIDILIGTHKLFNEALQFKKLGLLIVDEEHRFGVKQKEHIKRLRSDTDILSMTATPIPRTLNMAMAGIRDISLIATPPAKRLSVKTFWQQKSTGLIREAILREILRGGQVYYLHNDVKTMELCKGELTKIVPEARVEMAHGQMPERMLEKIMSDFYHHRFNVLVCSTIIETGIDIPTANTIIIERADAFGLAQLHQLRGRVGRSHHQAYAYLLSPPEKLLTADAKKRLEAIVALEDLGAGFALATQDLEIRGAGELLGEEQSGNMHALGFNLYMELLDKAVESLKSGKHFDIDTLHDNNVEINLGISAILPEDYVGDIHSRLVLYKRIANCRDRKALENIQVELIDRFGLLPQPAKNLILVSELRMQAESLGVLKIQGDSNAARIDFAPNAKINPAKLIELIQTEPKIYKLDGPTRLVHQFKADSGQERILGIKTLLSLLTAA